MQQRRATRYLRAALIGSSFILPAATLIPFGSLWLWEHGYLLHWAAAAFVAVLGSLALQWLLFRKPKADLPRLTEAGSEGWNERELAAWRAIEKYGDSLTPERVLGDRAFEDLTKSAIQIVAKHLHPQDENPIWNFTVPEALLVAERVASRLRPVVVENVSTQAGERALAGL